MLKNKLLNHWPFPLFPSFTAIQLSAAPHPVHPPPTNPPSFYLYTTSFESFNLLNPAYTILNQMSAFSLSFYYVWINVLETTQQFL